MRSILLLASCLVLLAGPARADSIALYRDLNADMCAMPSLPLQPHTVYVFHELSAGATGSSWRIANTTGMLSLGSSCDGLSITGDPYTGISLSYGSCLTGTFAICELVLMKLSSDPIPGCYQLRVLGYPDNAPMVTDCSDNPIAAGGGFFTFDFEGKINCWDCSTPVESTTWGRVRAMYR